MTALILSTLATMLIGCAGWHSSWLVVPLTQSKLERWLAACVLGLAVAGVGVMLLAHLGCFSRTTILGLLAVVAAAAWWLRVRKAPLGESHGWGHVGVSLFPLGLAAAAVLLACVAAWALPTWHWDSLGYHLPFVNYVVQSGSRAAVPPLIPYLSTYPHGIEYLFILFRSFLPDERWIDFGQIPLGLIGALATAGVAQRLGGKSEHVFVAGALWLTLPGVFLQLPTNYVDVGAALYFLLAAYWLLAPYEPRSLRPLVLATLALGLFFGAKPSAPLPTLLLAGVLAVRLKQVAGYRWVAGAAVAVAVLGGESYLRMWLATGNPLWPVKLTLGPIHLHGLTTVEELVATGGNARRPHGGFFPRLWQSWSTVDASPAFDMRLGGFGLVFVLFAVPGVLAKGVRALRGGVTWCSVAFVVVLLAAVAHPEPSTARFVLAFPALCLAAAVSVLRWVPTRVASALVLASTMAAGWGLWRAYPGLTLEDEHPLWQVMQLPAEERQRSMGPDGSPERWQRFSATLTSDDAVAFDESFSLPGFLWNAGLTNKVVALPWGLDQATLERTLREQKVTYLVAGADLVAGKLVRENPQTFEAMFDCGYLRCQVFKVLR